MDGARVISCNISLHVVLLYGTMQCEITAMLLLHSECRETRRKEYDCVVVCNKLLPCGEIWIVLWYRGNSCIYTYLYMYQSCQCGPGIMTQRQSMQIQLGAAVTWWYDIAHSTAVAETRYKSKFKLKRHPIHRPHPRAMGCLWCKHLGENWLHSI